jgi:hypothetical protein
VTRRPMERRMPLIAQKSANPLEVYWQSVALTPALAPASLQGGKTNQPSSGGWRPSLYGATCAPIWPGRCLHRWWG